MIDLKCQDCAESTKRIVGLWDGIGDNSEHTHGAIYDCESPSCVIRRERMEAIKRCEQNVETVRRINRENGIDANAMRGVRLLYEVSMRRAAQITGVGAAEYSSWENGRKAFPVDKYLKLAAYFSGDRRCENCGSFLGGIYGFCNLNSEKECGESGKHELWSPKEGKDDD